MMRTGTIITIAAILTLAIIPSCHKKNSDSETDPYLDGALSYYIPMYTLQGETYKLTPTGVYNPTTGNVGYYWYSSWITSKDTTKTETGQGDGSWTVKTPDETGSHTITCYAYATDYSPLYTIRTFYVVDTTLNSSITGAAYQADSLTFKDSRDGGTYYLSTIGGKVCMQNNLYYKKSGVSYQESTAVDPLFGRLYTWEEAQTACPSGWHLPSDAEFAAIASAASGSTYSAGQEFEGAAGSLMADAYFLNVKMWTFWPQVKITNNVKFSALPIGYAVDQDGRQKYSGLNSYATFWTTDNEGSTGIYRYLYVDKPNVYVAKGDKKSFRASVRCIKD